MRKNVGFRREIRASWFDAAAALRTETDDVAEIRRRLDDLLALEIGGAENRAITVQILLRLWAKPEPTYCTLHQEAIDRFASIQTPTDRVWLHFGLALMAYPFFRDAMSQAGLLLRQRGVITNAMLKQRIIAQIGNLGSLENATRSVMYALRQWQFVAPGEVRGQYQAGPRAFTDDRGLEAWLFQSALCSHQADAMPVGDLLGWSALFPFQLSLTARDIRQIPNVELHRHGSNIDIVRIVA